MANSNREIYIQVANRLAQHGIVDPTAQIVFLSKELENCKCKLRTQEELLRKSRDNFNKLKKKYTEERDGGN